MKTSEKIDPDNNLSSLGVHGSNRIICYAKKKISDTQGYDQKSYTWYKITKIHMCTIEYQSYMKICT